MGSALIPPAPGSRSKVASVGTLVGNGGTGSGRVAPAVGTQPGLWLLALGAMGAGPTEAGTTPPAGDSSKWSLVLGGNGKEDGDRAGGPVNTGCVASSREGSSRTPDDASGAGAIELGLLILNARLGSSPIEVTPAGGVALSGSSSSTFATSSSANATMTSLRRGGLGVGSLDGRNGSSLCVAGAARGEAWGGLDPADVGGERHSGLREEVMLSEVRARSECARSGMDGGGREREDPFPGSLDATLEVAAGGVGSPAPAMGLFLGLLLGGLGRGSRLLLPDAPRWEAIASGF